MPAFYFLDVQVLAEMASQVCPGYVWQYSNHHEVEV